jgi:hypothetical protein
MAKKVNTYIPATGMGNIRVGDTPIATSIQVGNFSTAFTASESPVGQINVGMNFGTVSGRPAEGNHLHTGIYLSSAGGFVDGDVALTHVGVSQRSLVWNHDGVSVWGWLNQSNNVFTLWNYLLPGPVFEIDPGDSTVYFNGPFVFNSLGGGVDFAVYGTGINPTIFSDSATNRVGIGIATPDTKLHVSGDVTVTDQAYGAGWNANLTVPTKNAVYDQMETRLTQAQADALFLTPSEADALFLTPVEADALFLTPAEGDTVYARLGSNNIFTGNQTIESSAPTIYFQEVGAAVDEGNWLLQANANVFFLYARSDAGVNNEVLRFTRAGGLVDSLLFNTNRNDFDLIVRGTADDNLLRIDSANNKVGIGVAVPAEKLDVLGNIKASGTAGTGSRGVVAGSTGVFSAPSGQPAETLVHASVGSGVASHSVNNCFSADYYAYRVELYNISTSGAVATIGMRLRVAGVDNSAAIYYLASTGYTSGAVVTDRGSSAATSWPILSPNATTVFQGYVNLSFSSPFVADRTDVVGRGGFYVSATTVAISDNSYGIHNVSSSFDGFTIFPSAGTLIIGVRVYGLRDAL